MPQVSGDGFVTAADGRPRWGRFGAAGILVRHVDRETGETWYFLARRSEHTHLGGTWAIPGGALDHGEEPLHGALREFGEEIGVDLSVLGYGTAGVHEDDHGGWSYWTVIVDVRERFAAPSSGLNWETSEVSWFRASELAGVDLFAAFRKTLARLGLLAS